MRRAFAEWLNQRGNLAVDSGRISRAASFYHLASRVDPTWSSPLFNLGLLAKFDARWSECRTFNQQAIVVNPKNNDAWWNLGIAATALRDWPEARRAWTVHGVEIHNGDNDIRMPPATACVRLNPKNDGEVVWGERLDPARIVITSVPLRESGHRFHDIVLNDGAQNGTRFLNGIEVPVFDELAIWKPSQYSTFTADLRVPMEDAQRRLVELCTEAELGVEDWSTIQFLCRACSENAVGPHTCPEHRGGDMPRPYAFAGKNEEEIVCVLRQWMGEIAGAEFTNLQLALAASE